jgi:hypothetical protein
VLLLERIAGIEDDGREEQKEEELLVELKVLFLVRQLEDVPHAHADQRPELRRFVFSRVISLLIGRSLTSIKVALSGTLYHFFRRSV